MPGGKETTRMLKELYAELGGRARGAETSPAERRTAPAARLAAAAPLAAARATIRARSRLLSRTRLNKQGSEKETWHIDFDLAGSGLDYAVGDSFGIFPHNDPGAGRCGDRARSTRRRIFRSPAGPCAKC